MYLHVQPTYKIGGQSITLQSETFTPSYSIIPYFCLVGTKDKNTNVYVQRFGQTNNTDIVYQHNFE
jgi:hypothetical protein